MQTQINVGLDCKQSLKKRGSEKKGLPTTQGEMKYALVAYLRAETQRKFVIAKLSIRSVSSDLH